ncbi:MAG: tatB [Rhizobiaceae bacterium]|nr:tatB [Rhizobiaceae bacterium]
MFDIGWTEMLVIAVVMIVVVGPKDLPKMLRTFGRTTAKMRAMAGDFQKQFNEAMREAELDDVKKSVESLKSLNPAGEIRKQLNPLEKAAADVRAGLDTAMKPAPKPSDPATTRAVESEPLKGGATAMRLSRWRTRSSRQQPRKRRPSPREAAAGKPARRKPSSWPGPRRQPPPPGRRAGKNPQEPVRDR